HSERFLQLRALPRRNRRGSTCKNRVYEQSSRCTQGLTSSVAQGSGACLSAQARSPERAPWFHPFVPLGAHVGSCGRHPPRPRFGVHSQNGSTPQTRAAAHSIVEG